MSDSLPTHLAIAELSREQLVDDLGLSGIHRVQDGRGPYTSNTFSLRSPRHPLIISFFEGIGPGITSKIAVRLAAEAVTERLAVADVEISSGPVACSALVQAALRQANDRVYEYGHRMAASGQVAALGYLAACDGDTVSIGRIGPFESWIWRQGRLTRFHEKIPKERDMPVLQRAIGLHSRILVDLSSVNVREGDMILMTPAFDEALIGVEVSDLCARFISMPDLANALALAVGRCLAETISSSHFRLRQNVSIAILRVGEPVIELLDPLAM